jgi:RNA polymerase sigma-70 factor (ECF subfamily)
MNGDARVSREEALRRAVLSGDEAAWRAWYDESFEALYRYAYWRCGGRRDQGEEIVQETWLIAVRRIRSFDPRQGSFITWLRGIAANARRNYLRKNKQTVNRDELLRDAIAAGSSENEQRELIAEALDALPERYEAVLRAKYLDGLSVCEVAKTWGETAKSIESLLTRARQAFREYIERSERNSANAGER